MLYQLSYMRCGVGSMGLGSLISHGIAHDFSDPETIKRLRKAFKSAKKDVKKVVDYPGTFDDYVVENGSSLMLYGKTKYPFLTRKEFEGLKSGKISVEGSTFYPGVQEGMKVYDRKDIFGFSEMEQESHSGLNVQYETHHDKNGEPFKVEIGSSLASWMCSPVPEIYRTTPEGYNGREDPDIPQFVYGENPNCVVRLHLDGVKVPDITVVSPYDEGSDGWKYDKDFLSRFMEVSGGVPIGRYELVGED